MCCLCILLLVAGASPVGSTGRWLEYNRIAIGEVVQNQGDLARLTCLNLKVRLGGHRAGDGICTGACTAAAGA